MAMDFIGLSVGMGYTDETVIGGGALKGKNCVVRNIEEVADGVNVTFQSILDDGTVKTDTVFIPKGTQGEDGVDGKSAYEIWLEAGNTGTEEDFLISLVGEKGDDGKSAYQYAQDGGYIGTETEFTTNIARSGVISKELEVERARIDNLTTLQDGSTTGDAELIDARIDKDGNTHVNVGEHIRTVSSQLSSEIETKVTTNGNTVDMVKEVYNADNVIQGYYLKSQGISSTILEIESEEFGYTEPIKAENKNYTFVGHKNDSIFCFDENNLLLGVILTSNDAPFNPVESYPTAKTFRVNIYLPYLETTSITKVDVVGKIDYLQIDNAPVEKKTAQIYVGSSREFQTIPDAVAYAETLANDNTIVDILIDKGTYDIIASYDLSVQVASWIGLKIPNNVNLIGNGLPKDIILTGELPIDTSLYSFEKDDVSILNFIGNTNIENMTINAKNMRYCIHTDGLNSVQSESTSHFRNLILNTSIDEGVTDASMFPLGSGSANGRKCYFENVHFNNNAGTHCACNIHNRAGSNKPCEWVFESCNFLGASYSVMISSYGSNESDLVVLKGCKFEQKIKVQGSGGYTGDNEMQILGYGNSTIEFAWGGQITGERKIDMLIQ